LPLTWSSTTNGKQLSLSSMPAIEHNTNVDASSSDTYTLQFDTTPAGSFPVCTSLTHISVLIHSIGRCSQNCPSHSPILASYHPNTGDSVNVRYHLKSSHDTNCVPIKQHIIALNPSPLLCTLSKQNIIVILRTVRLVD